VLCAARRWKLAGNGAAAQLNRNDESFLSQFEPLDVLGLDELAQRADVERRYVQLKSELGPQGARPDPRRLERVEQAFEILRDPKSIYYTRAVSDEEFKHRLAFQFTDSRGKLVMKVRTLSVFLAVIAFVFATLRLAIHPYTKVRRAALDR
jgi:hypothetical protein